MSANYRCAACGHEGKPGPGPWQPHIESVCSNCGSEDIFECGTSEADQQWNEAANAHAKAKRERDPL